MQQSWIKNSLFFNRENEVLKHQLKKYVGAVQMLRSNLNDKNSVSLQGEEYSYLAPFTILSLGINILISIILIY